MKNLVEQDFKKIWRRDPSPLLFMHNDGMYSNYKGPPRVQVSIVEFRFCGHSRNIYLVSHGTSR